MLLSAVMRQVFVGLLLKAPLLVRQCLDFRSSNSSFPLMPKLPCHIFSLLWSSTFQGLLDMFSNGRHVAAECTEQFVM